MTHLPKFSPALLHPRYWLLWLGIGLLWLVVQLPYPLIYRLGNAIGRLAMRFMKRRAKIAYRSFEHIRDVQAQQRGILLIGIHFLTLEMGARMFGMNEPGIGVYRPNDNPVIDWLQTWGRLRSNKDMIDRKDLKGMIRALKKGEVVWYAPDHDYGPTASVFAPLFAVDQAATTSGTWMLAKMSKACIVPFVPRRKPDGKGYELIILPPECSPPLDDAETTAAWMNKIVEQCIMMAPEQYMWLHRRFKTRPEGMPSRY